MSNSINFRVTDGERRWLEAEAKSSGLCISDVIRDCMHRKRLQQLTVKEKSDFTIYHQIQRRIDRISKTLIIVERLATEAESQYSSVISGHLK